MSPRAWYKKLRSYSEMRQRALVSKFQFGALGRLPARVQRISDSRIKESSKVC